MKHSLGKQPAHRELLRQGRTITGTARVIEVNPAHLHQTLRGRIRPNVRVRERLPALLGVPLGQLFDERLLRMPLDPRLLDSERTAS